MTLSTDNFSTSSSTVTLQRRKTGLTVYDQEKSAGGLTLYAPQTDEGRVYLIDEQGKEVHRWNLPVRPGRDAVLLPNGNLGFNGSHPDSESPYTIWPLWRGGMFMEVDPDGKIVWEYTDTKHHHDAKWLDNGHLLYTTAEPLPLEIAARLCGGVPSKEKDVAFGDVVKEVDRDGKLIWEWKSWEHLDPEDYPLHPIFDRSHWPLINGVDKTRDGLIMMSLRTTSGVIAVEPISKTVKWKIGSDIVAQQHTPVEMENGDILIFDNGNLRPGNVSPYSRVITVNPQTHDITWEYSDALRPAFFTPYMGSAQRLWNGNTFIAESAFGRLFEVTPKGDVVWEFLIPQFASYPEPQLTNYVRGEHNSVFRAHRYQRSDIPWL